MKHAWLEHKNEELEYGFSIKGKQQTFFLSLHHPLVWIKKVTCDNLEIPHAVLLADSGRWVVGGHQCCTSHEFQPYFIALENIAFNKEIKTVFLLQAKQASTPQIVPLCSTCLMDGFHLTSHYSFWVGFALTGIAMLVTPSQYPTVTWWKGEIIQVYQTLLSTGTSNVQSHVEGIKFFRKL